MRNPATDSAMWYGTQIFSELQDYIDRTKPSQIFFLCDENTHDFCLPRLLRELGDLPPTEVLEVPPGEDSKSGEVLYQLWLALADLQADRQSLVINLGGGVVSDLGGFMAGSYLRGIDFINIPTSLLAMVDASAGGKNGINLGGLKNRVGLFLPPSAVAIWPDFLSTLPMAERKSGFAEMLKHGLIADREYWERCRNFPIEECIPDESLIRRSIAIKQSFVNDDLRESGRRKALNFGHSIGHALESASLESATALLHGEAIALGMMAEVFLSVSLCGLPEEEANSAIAALRKIFPLSPPALKTEQLIDYLQQDKKNQKGELRFSLLPAIGEVEVDVAVSPEQAKEAIIYLKELTNGAA